jgi:hypothetical protein
MTHDQRSRRVALAAAAVIARYIQELAASG